MSAPAVPTTHLAAVVPSSAAGELTVTTRATPKPGPGELLLAVHAIALNPVDHYQRDYGFPPVSHYPAVLGSDVSGVVAAAGPDVPADAPKPGERVLAFASSFYKTGESAPNYGAMQQFVVVPAQAVVAIPTAVDFAHAALLPMAVQTAWAGWYTLGLDRETPFTAADKQAVLVWGGATSMGTAVIQSAKSLGFTVFSTASPKHHALVTRLGADGVWDYRSPFVVRDIVAAAKAAGVTIDRGYACAGNTVESIAILMAAKGPGKAVLASANRPGPPAEMGPLTVKFVSPSTDPEERLEYSHWAFSKWLKPRLESGEYQCEPAIVSVKGGLKNMDAAVTKLLSGMSGEKIVVEDIQG